MLAQNDKYTLLQVCVRVSTYMHTFLHLLGLCVFTCVSYSYYIQLMICACMYTFARACDRVWIHVLQFMHIIWRGPAVVVVYINIFPSVVCMCMCITNIMCHRLCICALSLYTLFCFRAILYAHVSVCCLPFDVYDSFDNFYGRAFCIGTTR